MVSCAAVVSGLLRLQPPLQPASVQLRLIAYELSHSLVTDEQIELGRSDSPSPRAYSLSTHAAHPAL